MRLVCTTALAALALATPALAADATLEGYGGDGALLVGIDSKDSPFGGSPPAQRGAPAGGARDDNLVAESGPLTQGSSPATQPAPATPPAATAPDRKPDSGSNRTGRNRNRGGRRSERRPANPPAEAPISPAIQDGERASGSASAGLPFTGSELALLLAALAGLAAMGAGMQRLAASQPRF